MSVPYDQQHDESVERPNAAPRGMHGQSVTRSAPYDERFTQELKSKMDATSTDSAAATESASSSSPPTSEPAEPMPRGVHGESVMRSTPYDERFAGEMKTKLQAENTLISEESTSFSYSLTSSEGEAPVAPPTPEEESAVDTGGCGGDTKGGVKKFVATTMGKIPGMGKK